MIIDEEEYLKEYQEIVKREYKRIETRKQLTKTCIHCGKIVFKYKICSNCYRNEQRWCSPYGKTINLNHIIALASKLKYQPSKELVILIKKLRQQHSNNDTLHNFISGYTLDITSYTRSLIVAFYFMFERNIIESGGQFKSYVIYLLINKGYLRDSLKRRMKLFDDFESQGLLHLLIQEHTNFMEFLDGKSLKRHYIKGNYSPYDDKEI